LFPAITLYFSLAFSLYFFFLFFFLNTNKVQATRACSKTQYIFPFYFV
jgi:hypothetical protein